MAPGQGGEVGGVKHKVRGMPKAAERESDQHFIHWIAPPLVAYLVPFAIVLFDDVILRGYFTGSLSPELLSVLEVVYAPLIHVVNTIGL